MIIKLLKVKPIFILLILVVTTFSCQDELLSGNKENLDVNSDSSISLKAATVDMPGRTLAANCFQCHGTNGYAGELKIAGESSSEIVSELNEMRAKNPRENIMNVHASAYTPDEIKLIGDYFSKQ